MIVLIALLVTFHTAEDWIVEVNPQQITHLRQIKKEEKGKAFTDKVECIINTSDGKYITVIETCDEVRRKLEEAK